MSNAVTNKQLALLQLSTILVILYFTSFYNYTLFHSLSEIFGVTVLATIFAIAWSSRRLIDNNFFLFVGIACLFIGLIDLLHIFSYGGMNVFLFDGFNLSSQLWISARLLTASSLFIAPFFIGRRLRPVALFWLYFFVVAIIFSSIFYWHNFPDSYIEGVGTTKFKIVAEYSVMLVFVLATWSLHRFRKKFEERVYNLLTLSIIMMIVSEMMMTSYMEMIDFSNMAGHFLKVSAFYFLYLAVVEHGLMRPYDVLFKNLKDREKAFKESDERYRSLVESSPTPIFLHAEGVFTYINPAGVRLFGARDKSEIIGRRVTDFIHIDHKLMIASRMTDIMKKPRRTVPSVELNIVTLDGKIIEVDSSDSLVNMHGKVAVQTMMRDITKKKNTERQLKAHADKIEQIAFDLRKFKLAVDNASDAVFITNDELQVVYANKAAVKMTGYGAKEMSGKSPLLWRAPAIGADEKKLLDAYTHRSMELEKKGDLGFNEEVVNLRKNGQTYVSAVEISPVFNERHQIIFFVIVERDITKAKEIDRAKTEFVSLASHQLRTPLASISLSSELLLRGIAGAVDNQQKRYLEEIYSSTTRMRDLIEALLNISRIELGTFVVKYEPLDVTMTIDQLVAEFKVIMKDKKIKFKKRYETDLPFIQFDKNILQIVVENLFSNAVRYTPAGGTISLEVSRGADNIQIKVADTGCGIPRDQQDKIFDKLFRAENAKSVAPEGAGLGLYMVQSVVTKVGGRIWFDSEEGRGTVFYVQIPLSEKRMYYCIEKR